METLDFIGPGGLVVAGVVLLAAGLFAWAKLRGRLRLVAILPLALVIGLYLYAVLVPGAEARQAREIFARLQTGAGLSTEEAEALQRLGGCSVRTREAVLRLAFSNRTNAAIALPRLEFLLQAHLRLDPDGTGRERLWRRIIQPAIKPPAADQVLLLAAGTADILRLGQQAVGQITGPFLATLDRENDPSTRFVAAPVLASLGSRIPSSQSERVTALLTREILSITRFTRAEDAVNRQRLECLVKGLAATVGNAGQAVARRIVTGFVRLMENDTNNVRVAKIAGHIDLFNPYFLPDDAQRVARRLVQAMTDRRAPYDFPELGDALAPLAGRMTAEQAEPLALQIASRMAQEGDLFRLKLLVKAVTPLVGRLGTEANTRFLQHVVSLIAQGVSQETLRQFAGLLASSADRLAADQASTLAAQLLEKTFKEPNSVTRSPLVTSFAAVASRLEPEAATDFADRLEGGLFEIIDRADGTDLEQQLQCLKAVAARLEGAHAQALANRLLAATAEKSGYPLVGITDVLLAMRAHIGTNTLHRVLNRILEAALAEKDSHLRIELFMQLNAVGTPLTSEQERSAVEPVIAALERLKGPLPTVVWELESLLDFMDADQKRRLGERLLADAENQRSPVPAFDTLQKFAGGLTPDQSSRAVDLLLARIQRSDPANASWLARKLPALAANLSGEDADRMAEQLVAPVLNPANPNAIGTLDARLPAIAPRLNPTQARKLASQLVDAIKRSTESLAVRDSDGMEPPRVFAGGAASYALLVSRTESATDLRRFTALCRALACLVPKLPDADVSELGGRIAVRLVEQGRHAPITFDSSMPVLLQHAPEQVLVEILKTPFAPGGLRQAVLQAWKLKTGTTFDDLWSFVSWTTTADAAKGLDLGTSTIPGRRRPTSPSN